MRRDDERGCGRREEVVGGRWRNEMGWVERGDSGGRREEEGGREEGGGGRRRGRREEVVGGRWRN